MQQEKARVIAIAQQKGGTGKTTTAAAIGAAYARSGKRVLFIDLDGQRNLTYSLNALNHTGATAAEVLAGKSKAAGAITSIKQPPCDLIPAADRLTTQALTGDNWQTALKDAIKPIRAKYDYIIIDTPPALGQLLAVTMIAADAVIIPTLADFFSLQGVNQICQTIEQARQYNGNLNIAGILITRFDRRKVLTRDTAALIEQTASNYRTKVFTTKIRECIALAESAATQTDIFTYAPKSTAAIDYNQLIKEL